MSAESYNLENTTNEFVIAHINDTHAAVFETDSGSMGYAKIKTIVDGLRRDNHVILLDAGDAFYGQPFARLTKGDSIAKIMNSIKYDAMTVGNHDLGYGRNRLKELEKSLSFPIIAANIVDEEGKRVFNPYIIKHIADLKVGIFGLATPETPSKLTLENIKGLSFLNPEESAKQMVHRLKDEKVDLIIALTHLGLKGSFSSIKLAKEVDGIDVIVDGHSHDTLNSGMYINNTLIVQAGGYTMNIGVVKIQFKNKKVKDKRAYLITKEEAKKTKPDTNLQKYIDMVENEVQREMGVIVAQLDRRLEGERQFSGTREIEIGNLLAKATHLESGADGALMNGRLIRGSLEPGNVTMKDILRVLPFENVVVIKKLRGINLIKALENGLSLYPEQNAAFPHLSGITIKFDPSRARGNRIIEARINGKDILPDKFYKIAFSEICAEGGDGFGMVAESEEIGRLEKIDKIFIKYVKKYGFKDAVLTGNVENIPLSGKSEGTV